ncbi:zona pellucida sperm-binding protein 3d.2 [Trichomycterus rosablanca]|uniref:zona pellucida sperm-binding protein 3d.2 n=1 Tax=Trichomycterus rosablanca TaxID=2290929 RepID=UPI002F3533AC
MGLILHSLCALVALLSPAARATESTSGAFPLALDPSRSSPGEEERLEPPYLTLPVYLHSRSPLVPKQRFSLAHARARLQRVQVPERVRQLLLPAPRRPQKSRRVRGAVRVACSPKEMRVRIQTESARVKLGTCGASASTEQFVMFQYDLQQCGTHRQVINGTVTYSNTLHYVPDESSSDFFSIPVQCHFNRFHYSYKIGFVPHVETVRFFKPIRTKGSVSLSVCDENWNKLPPLQGFVIGHPVFLEAEVPLVSEGERLHSDFCHITTKSSRLSLPRLDIIHNYGCMIYSNGSQWRFMKSDRRNVVRFSIDAFTLQGLLAKHLFLHCEMSVRDATATPTSKFCTYNQQDLRWEELYGSDSVCSCCDSSCLSETPEGEIKYHT